MSEKYRVRLSEEITPHKPKKVKLTIDSLIVEYPLIPRVGDKLRVGSYWWLVKDVYLYPSQANYPPYIKVEFYSFD